MSIELAPLPVETNDTVLFSNSDFLTDLSELFDTPMLNSDIEPLVDSFNLSGNVYVFFERKLLILKWIFK